ncbi:peptidase M75 family protein [Nakamurella flava]|uniref:Peptidase M75 family protein n=1 Tax=Nakamurella flava TaxID=2576308 RepID=A0A4U6QFY9_9ACTN|nr:iron uptake system protein EfeO [Nakamurella flava]TKV59207.1 peptidase M75 family protein [Nakamurella flava]
MSSSPRHRWASAAVLLSGSLLLAACGSAPTTTAAPSSSAASSAPASSPASSGSAAPAADGSTAVTITITDADGCTASTDSVPAGPVDFTVTNKDALGVTEVELVSDQRIVGERENLAPGFDSVFSARLDGGSYEIYCPGASTERRPFTVTGQAAQQTGDVAELLTQATKDYAAYVDDQISFLVPPVQEMAAAIKAGDVAAAQQAYAKARPFYERIEPVAESFPDLDPAIDLRIGDVEQGTEWTGFHPIEQGLFEKKSTDGLADLADGLVADIGKLQTQAKALSDATDAGTAGGYQAFEIANGASGLLDEVLASKITGEEEAYSKLDLLDFEANVEGSLQAFATLKPALDQIDPTVVPNISAKFDALMTLLNTYKDPSAIGGWKPFDQLTDSDRKQLTDALLAVQEPLSAVAAKITN